MKIVADASIVMAVVMNEPARADIIRATLGRRVIAPSVLPYEIGNALAALVKRRLLDASSIASIWTASQQIPIELRATNIPASLDIAAKNNLYAYDAYYIECARSSGCSLLTLDRNMMRTARQLGLAVMELK